MILSIVLWLRMCFNVSHFGFDAKTSPQSSSAGGGARNILDRPGLTSSCAPLLTARFARSQAFVNA
jgi:hypothetical protein